MKKKRLKDLKYFCQRVCAKGRCQYLENRLYRNLKRLHSHGEPTEEQVKEVVRRVLPITLKEEV